MKNVAKFKGSKLFLTDDLTKMRRKLLQDAKDKMGSRNAWSFKGQIYIRTGDGSVRIGDYENLQRQG